MTAEISWNGLGEPRTCPRMDIDKHNFLQKYSSLNQLIKYFFWWKSKQLLITNYTLQKYIYVIILFTSNRRKYFFFFFYFASFNWMPQPQLAANQILIQGPTSFFGSALIILIRRGKFVGIEL